MIRLAFPCCKHEVNPYANLLKSSINLVLKQDVSPLSGKKLMLYTNGDKQLLGNYLPISLLPISGKVLGRLLYNSMFEVFMENIQNRCFICYLLHIKFHSITVEK